MELLTLDQTHWMYSGIAAAPNGNIYTIVYHGNIYRQIGGTGDFGIYLVSTALWKGITVAPNGDIYACTEDGVIYRQTGGTGDFVNLNQAALQWNGMTSAPNGNIYAFAYNGDIYMQSGGTGDFVALGQTPRNWYGMTVSPNGNVYACVYGGDIYMQTNGAGDFIALGQTSRNWRGNMAAAPNGDIYACVNSGDVYIQTNGTGNFIATGQTSRGWYGITISPTGDVYACVYSGDIYFDGEVYLDIYYKILNIPLIGFKNETVPFIPETLTASDYKYSVNADSIKVTLNIESYSQDIRDGSFSNFQSIAGKKSCVVDFSIDLYTKDTLTTAPTYYDILKSCGWKQIDTSGGLMIFPDSSCNRVPSTIEISFPEEQVTPRQLVYKIAGAMGNVKISGTTGNSIKAEFSFLGKLVNITYCSYANMIVPTGFDSEKPNALISCTFKLFDTEAYLDSFIINSNEIVNLFSNINDASGYDGSRIIDRYTYGDFTIFDGTDLSSDMFNYITFE